MSLQNRRFRLNPEVIDTFLQKDEAALIHLGTKLTYRLNQTGINIWCSLREGCTVPEISKRLHEEFDVEPELAAKGVLNFIEELLFFQLIEFFHE